MKAERSNRPKLKVIHYEVTRERTPSTCGKRWIRPRMHPFVVLMALSCLVTYASHRWGPRSSPTFVYRRSLPRNTSWLPATREGYLVYSHACQIPEIAAYHPSIVSVIGNTPRFNCSERYPMYSYNDLDRLYVDTAAIMSTTRGHSAVQPVSCCYSEITRKPGKDSAVDVAEQCIPVENGSLIPHEFVRLACYDAEGTLAYVNYHAFVVNKTNVEKRIAAFADDNRYRYSVLIVGPDGMSRQSMHRQMPKTVGFLVKRMNAIEMKGMNKVGEDTLHNLIPLLMGYHYDEADVMHGLSRQLDWCPLIWKNYRDAGYATMYAEDTVDISTFNYLKVGFRNPPTDYYPRPLLLAFEKELGHYTQMSCRYCVGPQLQAEFILDYVRHFATRFRDSPYFAFAWINSLSHDFATSRWVGDEVYVSFFERLFDAGHLSNTIVLFLSDHGMRWGAIRRTYAGQMEDRLPGHFWVLPPRFRRHHPNLVKAMTYNTRRLSSPFDTYATLRSIPRDFYREHGNDTDSYKESDWEKLESDRMKSLFKPLPKERSCEDLDMDEQWCTCHRHIAVDINDGAVHLAAKHVVHSINKKLNPYSHICAPLRIQNISEAYMHSIEDYSDVHDYTVIVSTEPGESFYEGTVRIYKGSVQLLGSIALLSIYGNRSTCVQVKAIKKFCYCK